MYANHPNLTNYEKYTHRIHWHHSELHSHSYWEFVLVTEGTAHHICNGITQDITRGQMLFIRPTDVHGYLPDATSPKDTIPPITEPNYEHRDLFIYPSLLHDIVNFLNAYDIIAKLYQSKHPVVITLSNDQLTEIESQLNILERFNGEQTPAYDRIHKLLICQILSILARQFDFDNSKSPVWLQTLMQKMHEQELICGPLDAVIKVSGFSHGHLCRLFKKYTGQCLITYFRKLKMQYAANLLVNSNASVLDIATAVGYDSPSNFIIQFRRFSGMTPKNYRTHFLS